MPLVPYSRCSFKTRLPDDRLYAPSHHWLARDDEGYRVGFTTFATRMLGEVVDLGFDVAPGDEVAVGDVVGWVEGFKALTELYTPMAGRFLGANPGLDAGLAPVGEAPWFSGWLFRVDGAPPADALDVDGYARFLDDLIDRMSRKTG